MKEICNKTIKNQGFLRYMMVRNAKAACTGSLLLRMAVGKWNQIKPEFKSEEKAIMAT
jgi:hypothetical protein